MKTAQMITKMSERRGPEVVINKGMEEVVSHMITANKKRMKKTRKRV